MNPYRLGDTVRSLRDAGASTRDLELGNGTGGPWFFDGDLALLAKLPSVVRLRVARREWTREDLSHIAAMRSLRWIELEGDCESSHWPIDLSPLAALPRLEVLHIENIAFSTPAPLASLDALRRLSLRYDPHATEAPMFTPGSDLSPLCVSREMVSLSLRGRTGLRLDLRRLGHLAKLEELDLTCEEAAELDDLSPLRHLARLRSVDLDPRATERLHEALRHLLRG